MRRRQTRIFPKAVTAELRRLPWRALGLALAIAACLVWLALLSWSFGDPSLNYSADAAPRNLLGSAGAKIADALLMVFGLGAPLLVLPLFSLGAGIMEGKAAALSRWRLIFWLMAALFVPAFFSCLPNPPRWPLNHGAGGLLGDLISALVPKPLLSQPGIWGAASAFFCAFGLWSLANACGTGLIEFARALFGRTAPEKTVAAPTFIPPTPEETISRRLTSWTQRFTKRNRALVAVKSAPVEFWMKGREPKFSDPPSPEEKIEPVLVSAAPEKAPKKASPFARWGGPAPVRSEETSRFEQARGHESSDKPGEEPERIEPYFGPARANPAGPDGPDGDDDISSTFTGERHFPPKQERIQGKPNGVHFTLKPKAAGLFFRDEALSGGYEEDEEEDAVEAAPALPPLTLLNEPPRPVAALSADDPELTARAAMLMEVLSDFGVKGRIASIHPGPVITLFELEPARGTKSSRVVGLADDIARSMSAVSARVAVVPGRDAIGIELPNAKREMVSLRGMLASSAYQSSQAALPLALGKSIGGDPIIADLSRMPHVLIAGTTGSGKSVGINTMILSLLYRLPPQQCNFIMIDPKMLELSIYDGIPHLLAPVVTDPKKAIAALKWTVREMNSRYERMCKLGVRNISNYNAKAAAALLRGEPLSRVVQTGFDPVTGEPVQEEEVFDPQPMPYIVVVIDEMADLMMVAGKDIEFAVQRLSQMARAAGIHLIMATQRPSVDVVTGTIKANFPTRISFQVTSKIDSRTIIGEQGAEQLLGAGDLLYMAAGGRIIRAHGPFVSDEEVERVVRHLRAQGAPRYRDDILEDGEFTEDAGTIPMPGRSSDLYAQAVEIVLKDRKPTTSYLQRRLGIGYNRAASLIERMEQEGIIGAANRTGRREILVDASP